MIEALFSFLGGLTTTGLRLYRAANLQHSLGLNVRFKRFFCGMKQTKIMAFTVIIFAFSHILICFFVKANSKIPSLVVAFRLPQVLQIKLLSSASKIAVGVIALVSVYVVYVCFRPKASHKQNRASVGVVFASVNRELNVPVGLSPSCNVANFGCSTISQADKVSRFWIVVKEHAQDLRGKIALSHDALQMLIGQRPEATANRFGLRYFSRIGCHA